MKEVDEASNMTPIGSPKSARASSSMLKSAKNYDLLSVKSEKARIKNISAPGRKNSSCKQIGTNIELHDLIKRKRSSFDEDILQTGGAPQDSGLKVPPRRPSENKTGRSNAMRIQTSALENMPELTSNSVSMEVDSVSSKPLSDLDTPSPTKLESKTKQNPVASTAINVRKVESATGKEVNKQFSFSKVVP